MKTTKILFITALILSVSFQAEAKKVQLQYQFKTGDQFKYEMIINQDISQEMMGQSMTTTNLVTSTYEFTVTEITSTGDYIIKAGLVAYSLQTKGANGEMKYDSATDKEVPAFAETTAVSLNQFYFFTLSPLGKISDVKVPEGLLDKVNKILEGMGEAAQIAGSAATQGVTAEGFQKSMQGYFMNFPEGGVEPKTPWTQTDKVSQMVLLNVKTSFELSKASKDANEIKISSQITQDPATPPMEMQGATITYDLNGTKEGTLVLDPATGMPISSEGVTSISGSLSVDSPDMPTPMSIPMTVRSTDKLVKK